MNKAITLNEAVTYSIGETSERTGLPRDTIRYYEKIGLLQRAERKDNRHRVYDQADIDRMKMITCLKKTGMSLDDMRPYLDNATLNPEERPELYGLFEQHRAKIAAQMESLQQILDFIDTAMMRRTKPEGNCDLKGDVKRMPLQKS